MTRAATVGVTIGVGSPYSALAPLAASCFTVHTGIPSLVLGQNEFATSGLRHPAALRLRVFDYANAERVVYFDADWLCIGDWTPTFSDDNSEILACRDFVLTSEWPQQKYDFQSDAFLAEPIGFSVNAGLEVLRHDYIDEIKAFAGLRSPCSRWINTGLLLINRSHHQTLLDTALQFYEGKVGHHQEYFEQPAFMKAIEHLDVPLRLLPRKLNVFAAYERRWSKEVVGLHIKVKRHNTFLAKVNEGLVKSPKHVEQYFREL